MRHILSIVFLLAALPAFAADKLRIVAAENFYGDVAAQIAGSNASVQSILSNPDQDPHLFEASPSVARAISTATIVVQNGVDYDPWMNRLLTASPRPARVTITVADLTGHKSGDNPHIWYDPATMPAYARALTTALSAADPAHAAEYTQRRDAFLHSLAPIDALVASLREHVSGQPVTATEPVFGYMAVALGLTMRNERFQEAVMNNTEPSASDIAAMEADLREHRVRALFYNSQATDPAAQRLLRIAREAHVPVVPVTETEPAHATYQSWMIDTLKKTAQALGTTAR